MAAHLGGYAQTSPRRRRWRPRRPQAPTRSLPESLPDSELLQKDASSPIPDRLSSPLLLAASRASLFNSLKYARRLFYSYQRLSCGYFHSEHKTRSRNAANRLAACKALASTKLCSAPGCCHARLQSNALPAFRSRLHTASAGPTLCSSMRPQAVTCAESKQCR